MFQLSRFQGYIQCIYVLVKVFGWEFKDINTLVSNQTTIQMGSTHVKYCSDVKIKKKYYHFYTF